ncbi:MAG: hypothetical protein U0326_10465 [Polyangiales bacterium]
MRKLALLAALGACHATTRAPPAQIAPAPAVIALPAATPETPPVATPTTAPTPPPAPPFGLLFARHCEGYLRPLTVSPSASRLLSCDRIFDDEGRYHATPRRPVAALLDDGALLVFARDALTRTSADGSVQARSARSSVDGQSDLVTLGPGARTALWLRTRTRDLVELDLASMRTLRRVRLAEGVGAIAYAHDGTPIVTGGTSEHRTLARWEGAALVDIPLPEGTQEVALSELGAVALAIADRTHITTISLPDGGTRAAHTLAVGDEPALPSPDAPLVSPSPDGHRVVVCDARGLSLHRLDERAAPVVIHDRCGGPPRFSADGRSIVTSEFSVSLLREGAPARVSARREAVTFEPGAVPEGFVPWVRANDRGQDVLTPEGSSPDDTSHMVPEGYVRAWHHTTAGANLWITHHEDDALRLDQPLGAWALAALDVFGDPMLHADSLVAWRDADGARVVEARWRQGGCDPADVILRVQERAGGVMVLRMEAWSSRELRHRWWRAMVTPVLGEAPANATAVTPPREETD